MIPIIGTAIAFVGLLLGGTSLMHNVSNLQQKIHDLEAKTQSLEVKTNDKLWVDNESNMKDPEEEGSFGAVNLAAGKPAYYLYGSGISASATSLTLTAFTQPVSGYRFDMTSHFGDIGYLTLEPGNTSRQEFVSFTGIAYNSDGTATLSGLTRGLAGVSPFTASTTLQVAHGGGTAAVLSNPPQVYNLFPKKADNETITGTWTFSTFPITPSNGTSSETVAGVVELATGAEAAASNQTGLTGARTVLPSSLATSTYATSTAANRVIVTNGVGVIDPAFLGTTTIAFHATTTSGFAVATSSAYIGAFPAYNIGKNVQVITTTGTTTFTVPIGVTKIMVQVQAGGGSGGTGTGTDYGSGGGGAGGYSEEVVDVTGTSSIQVYVGAASEPSKFGTNGFYLSATQGSGGASAGIVNAGGAGGCGSGGDLNTCGGGGGSGGSNATSGGNGGSGGSSRLGGGGNGAAGDGTGGNGGNYGGGGGGGSQAGSSGGGSGGSGAQGVVIVRW